jgi:sarcosine oxidase subunit gamma
VSLASPSPSAGRCRWSRSRLFRDAPTRYGKHSAEDGNVCALWLGPDRWLLVGSDASLADRLARSVGAEDGSVVDLGQARTALRLSGPRARDVLAHGTGIDLHLDAFGPGACATTLVGHVGAILHCAAADTIDVYLPRSYAQTAWEWLLEVAARHGRRVEEVAS